MRFRPGNRNLHDTVFRAGHTWDAGPQKDFELTIGRRSRLRFPSNGGQSGRLGSPRPQRIPLPLAPLFHALTSIAGNLGKATTLMSLPTILQQPRTVKRISRSRQSGRFGRNRQTLRIEPVRTRPAPRLEHGDRMDASVRSSDVTAPPPCGPRDDRSPLFRPGTRPRAQRPLDKLSPRAPSRSCGSRVKIAAPGIRFLPAGRSFLSGPRQVTTSPQ
jgi:hypothetical protein